MTGQASRRVRDGVITIMLGLGVTFFAVALLYLLSLFLIGLLAMPPLIFIVLLAVISVVAAVALM